jgi:hypothetical protein
VPVCISIIIPTVTIMIITGIRTGIPLDIRMGIRTGIRMDIRMGILTVMFTAAQGPVNPKGWPSRC